MSRRTAHLLLFVLTLGATLGCWGVVPAAANVGGVRASIVRVGTSPVVIAARGGSIVLRAQVRNAVRCSFQGQHFSSDGFHRGPTVTCRSGRAAGRMRVAANPYHYAVKIHFLVAARDSAGKTVRKTFAATQAAAPAPPPPPSPPAQPLAVQTSVLPNGAVGVAYSATLNAAGGAAPYSWAIVSGELPAGVAVSGAGTIAGTPASTGQWTFSVAVTDSKGSSASASFSLTVGAAPTPAPTAGSSNWSGYVLTGAAYTAVTGTFNVPQLASAPTDATVSEWVGIDGVSASDPSLIQAGVAEQYSAASNTYLVYAWVEELPAPARPIPLAVVAGDQVTVTISQVSVGEWDIAVKDDSTGQQYSIDVPYSGPGSSAEWIVEAPTLAATGAIETLANFAPVTFTQLGVDPVVGALTRVVMYQNGVPVSSPSDLSPTGFTVAYGGVAPAAP
jgi:hypothetical protein